MRANLLIASLLWLGLCVIACAQKTPTCTTQTIEAGQTWLSYEPSIVHLRGFLQTRAAWGPPNYGENPLTDSRELEYYLDLERPIEVKGDPSSDINSETLTGITTVQLICGDNSTCNRYVRREAIVTGALTRSHSGHHHVPLLLTVNNIEPLGPFQPFSDPQRPEFPDDHIVEVASDTYWLNQESYNCRAMIWNEGSEEVHSSIHLQWYRNVEHTLESIAVDTASAELPKPLKGAWFIASQLQGTPRKRSGPCEFTVSIVYTPNDRSGYGEWQGGHSAELKIIMRKPGDYEIQIVRQSP